MGFLFFFFSFLSIFYFTKVVNFCWEKTQFTLENDLLFCSLQYSKNIANKKIKSNLMFDYSPKIIIINNK